MCVDDLLKNCESMANLKSFRFSAAVFPFYDFTVNAEPF